MNETIRTIAKKHPNEWPQKALDRLLYLRMAGWIHTQEYRDLLEWARETIEAGVAFKQSAEAA